MVLRVSTFNVKDQRVLGGHRYVKVHGIFFFKLKISEHFRICSKARIESEPQIKPTVCRMKDCQSNLEERGGNLLHRDKDPAMTLWAGLGQVVLGESQWSSRENLSSPHPTGVAA